MHAPPPTVLNEAPTDTQERKWRKAVIQRSVTFLKQYPSTVCSDSLMTTDHPVGMHETP